MDVQVVTYRNTMFRESESKVKFVPEFVVIGIIFIFKRGTFSSLLMVSGDETSESEDYRESKYIIPKQILPLTLPDIRRQLGFNSVKSPPD